MGPGPQAHGPWRAYILLPDAECCKCYFEPRAWKFKMSSPFFTKTITSLATALTASSGPAWWCFLPMEELSASSSAPKTGLSSACKSGLVVTLLAASGFSLQILQLFFLIAASGFSLNIISSFGILSWQVQNLATVLLNSKQLQDSLLQDLASRTVLLNSSFRILSSDLATVLLISSFGILSWKVQNLATVLLNSSFGILS